MRFAFVLSFLLLAACSMNAPSQAIVENTRREVAAVQQTVKKIATQTPPECKTDVFIANLEAVSNQITSIGGQIESIGLSCQTEKEVLQEKISTREMTIVCLVLLIAGLVFFLFKKRG